MPEFQMNGKDAPEFQSLDDFTQGYIEAAFFTESEKLSGEWELTQGREREAIEETPLGFSGLAPETLAAIVEDCRQFRDSLGDDGLIYARQST